MLKKAIHRLPYAHVCWTEEGAKVKPGDKLAEWDPFTMPIITEKDGVAHYFDMIEGVSISEKMDEATGISSKVVIDWRSLPKGGDLKPRIALLDKKIKVITLSPNGLPPITIYRWMQFSPLKTVRKSKRVILWRVFHANVENA